MSEVVEKTAKHSPRGTVEGWGSWLLSAVLAALLNLYIVQPFEEFISE